MAKAGNEVNLFKIEHELNGSVWRAHVAAFNIESAAAYIARRVPGCKITSQSHLGPVQFFTPEVANMVYNNLRKDRPDPVKPEKLAPVEQEQEKPEKPEKKSVRIGK